MGCKLNFAVAGFRRQNIGRIGDLLKFQIKCKFRDGMDSFTGPYLIDLLTALTFYTVNFLKICIYGEC